MTVALRFAVRVKPGARKANVGGRRAGVRGDALLVSVTARAVEGQANDAVRRALADEFEVRPADVQIVSGERARDKLIEITRPPEGAAARLESLLASGQL